MTNGIDWDAYYRKEAELLDLGPETDAAEVHRCFAALSVFPRGRWGSLLDAGCGDGFFCHWIHGQRSLKEVVGTDVSEERLRRAESRYPEVRFMQGRLPALPFADGAFDIVTCIEVLEHQEDPAAAVRELARIARAFVVLCVPGARRVRPVLCPHCLRVFPASGHLHVFDRERLASMAQAAGLDLEQIRPYYTYAYGDRGGPLRWLGWATMRARRLLRPEAPPQFLAVRLRKVS